MQYRLIMTTLGIYGTYTNTYVYGSRRAAHFYAGQERDQYKDKISEEQAVRVCRTTHHCVNKIVSNALLGVQGAGDALYTET